MKKSKTGHFIFINSVAGKYGHSFSNSTAYVSSKYGLRGFADSLRTELRDYNIKVTSIYPGAIDTSFWDSINVDFPLPGGALITQYSSNGVSNSSNIFSVAYSHRVYIFFFL